MTNYQEAQLENIARTARDGLARSLEKSPDMVDWFQHILDTVEVIQKEMINE